jgi:hypothetical protein
MIAAADRGRFDGFARRATAGLGTSRIIKRR